MYDSDKDLKTLSMASLPNNISLKIEIWKGWFTADTDSKVYNVSRVGTLPERNRK